MDIKNQNDQLDYICGQMVVGKDIQTSTDGTIKSNASILQPHTASQSVAEMTDSEGRSFVMSLTTEGQSYVK